MSNYKFAPTTVIVSRVQRFIDNPRGIYPVSCTAISVEDSYYDVDGEYSFYETIAGSRVYTTKVLKGNAGVLIDLNKLRPQGTVGSGGMVAQGVTNFMSIYSMINQEVRRGSVFKNGAVVLALDYDHPDFIDFLNFPDNQIPWAKRNVGVDADIIKPMYKKQYQALLNALADGRCFVTKKQYNALDDSRMLVNVCVTADTWVNTTDGSKKVSELVGETFEAVVDGIPYSSTPGGFWSNGIKPVYRLTTKEGYFIEATSNHKLVKATRKGYHDPYQKEWTELGSFVVGDKIQLNNLSNHPHWGGTGTHGTGWLLGQLIGNGSMYNGTGILSFFGDYRNELFDKTVELVKSELGLAKNRTRVYNIGTGSHDRHRTDDGRDHWVKSLKSKLVGDLALSYDITQKSKIATSLVEKGNFNFYCGFLQGLFDADSHVSVGKADGSGKSIQFGQSNLDTIQVVHRMLLRLGIKSTIYDTTKHQHRIGIMPGADKPSVHKPSYRLDITGSNIDRYQSLVGFSKPDKIESLNKLTNTRRRNSSQEQYLATVSKIEYIGEQEVYDCTINEAHCFDANGFIAHNCVGLTLRSRSTCTLAHVNLGLIESPEQIVQAMIDGAKDLAHIWELFNKAQIDRGDHFIDPVLDKQVGLGFVGLANMLAHFKVTYAEFVQALETKSDNVDANELAEAFRVGYGMSSVYFKMHNFERGYTIEPTASCSYKQKDLRGYTTTPEISPPVCHPTTKIARRQSQDIYEDYQYPPDVEVAGVDVDDELYTRLCCAFQKMMNDTELAQMISYNWWLTRPVNEVTFEAWLDSPLQSIYYRWAVSSDNQDKTNIGIEESDEDSDFWSAMVDGELLATCEVQTQLNSGECTSCAG